MTDRVKALVVTLDADYRTDDVEAITNAIRMVKGVKAVQNVNANIDDHVNRERVRHEMTEKIYEVLNPKMK